MKYNPQDFKTLYEPWVKLGQPNWGGAGTIDV